jgi:WhiB family redox-sensing transcriptional regulator
MATWEEHAACRGEDTNLFFPDGHRGEFVVEIEKAKAICRACPVRENCLIEALNSPEKYGIWGGLDENERGLLRRNDRRRRHPQFVSRAAAS